MTSRAVVVLECDRCGTQKPEDGVETITLGGLEGEACKGCRKEIFSDAFEMWMEAARRGVDTPRQVRATRAKRKDSVALANSVAGLTLMQWPNTPWRFTSHALQRMGERFVMMEDLLPVLKHPDVTRPGDKNDGVEVWLGGRLKVVVNPEQHAVLTVAMRDEGE